MTKWNNEQAARQEILGLVAEYYNEFKKGDLHKCQNGITNRLPAKKS